ncbi:MAG: MFS transporter [Promethearchaeota archaeon]
MNGELGTGTERDGVETDSGRRGLSTRLKAAYGLGNVGGLAIGQSSILLLYTYYYLYLRVPLSPLGISAILVVYGVWDALNEPLLGHFSDVTRSRIGRRKPFILAGIVPTVVLSVLAFTPPTNDPVACAVYLLVVLVARELGITMVVTSWYSLYAELTLDPVERVDLSKFMQLFGIVGLVLGLGVAPIISGLFEDVRLGYSVMGLVVSLITVLSVLPTVLLVKERPDYQVTDEERLGFLESVKVALANRSFLAFVAVQFLLQLSYALVVSSLPLFFEGVLGLESLQWSLLLLATFASVVPSLYLWMRVARRRGSKGALTLSMAAFAVVFPLTFVMNSTPVALVVLLAAGVGLAGLMMFPTILLGDVIDEDQLHTNRRREGVFTGVSGVIVKMSSAISWALIGVVLTAFQVDRDHLDPGTITSLNKLGLQFLVGVLPVLVVLLGMLALHFYPLAGEKLAEIKRRVLAADEVR